MSIDTTHRQNLDKISTIFPENIEQWKYIDEGFDSHAYQINREWIFKIPRRDDVWETLMTEKSMLDAFHSVSPVQVPHFEFVGDDVLGYRMVQGEPLTDELFKSMNKRNRDKIAEDLGIFLSDLHSLDFTINGSYSYRDHYYRDGFEKLISKAEKHIYHRLPSGTVKNIESFLSQMSSDESNFSHRKSVVHADLHHSHILWDRKNESLGGIIDFGEMSQNASLMDLTYLDALYITENDEFMKKVISSYRFSDDCYLDKVQLFSKFELLYWPINIITSAELAKTEIDQDELDLFLGYIRSSYGE